MKSLNSGEKESGSLSFGGGLLFFFYLFGLVLGGEVR